jgi:predicted lipid-binding transport protein (Tim44 family)
MFQAGGVAAPAAAATAAINVPAGFDTEGFVRIAKLNFIRLQAANDAKNLDDMREFTSPELFAEIKLQMDERGNAPQQTDVVMLNAELLEVITEGNRHIASVRFSGLIREEAGAAPAQFEEVWHLIKPVEGDKGWTIAGIQQVN